MEFKNELFENLARKDLFKYLKFFPLLLLMFIFTKRIFIYSIFTVFTAIIIYYTKLYHLPIDVSPLFFLEIVITRYYGMQYTLLFVLLAYILPKTYAGSNMKFDSYVFISISMFANVFALIFPEMPLLAVGLITSIAQYIGGVIFQTTFKPLMFSVGDGIANVANNILWFLIFSDLIVFVMG